MQFTTYSPLLNMFHFFDLVSRSLASCQGALLLVDSTQSIQAQTLANFEKAKNLGLTLIPIGIMFLLQLVNTF